MTSTREKGNLAERLVEQFLRNKGFVIVERNYYCRYGEIDLICYKEKVLHFVEVKASYNRHSDPVENCNSQKIRKLIRTAAEYRLQYESAEDRMPYFNWTLSLAAVSIDQAVAKATIQWVDHVLE